MPSFYCGICEESIEHEGDSAYEGIAAFMDHARVLHPDTYDAIERWPDDKPVVVDNSVEPGDFA